LSHKKPLEESYSKVDYTQYGLAPGVYSLTEKQVELGARVDVIAAKNAKAPKHERAPGIEVHRVVKPYEIMAMAKMRKLDTKKHFSLIHTHATAGFLYVFLKHLITKRRPLVTHVHGTTAGVFESLKPLTAHGMQRTFRERYWSWISLERQKIMWSSSDKLLCVSSGVAEELQHLYGITSEKLEVVYNGVDVEYFKPANKRERSRIREKLGIRDDAPFLLYVGHLSPRKGIRFLLKAVPEVLSEFPNATFALVGGTPKFVKRKDYLQTWIGMAEKLKVQRNVLFLGEVGHNETLTYYQAADVFVFPTLYEGLAKALLEAMACELPIVATKIGGNGDAIANGKNGFLVNPYDSEELSSAVIEVLSNPSFGEQLGKNARQTACRSFTWEGVAKRIHSVYEEVLKG